MRKVLGCPRMQTTATSCSLLRAACRHSRPATHALALQRWLGQILKDPPSHTAATLRSSNLPLTSLEPLTEARAERRRTGAHPITAYLQELERACAGSCWRLHRFKLLAARDRRMMLLPRAQAISAGFSNASPSHATRLGCCDDVSTFAGRRREPPDTCEAPQIFTGVSRQTPLLHWRCAFQQDAGGIFGDQLLE